MNSDQILGPMNLAVATAMGIFLGVGMAGSTSVIDFFHQWETLIAGMLAVVAGGMTVVGMLVTDQRQQKRHDRLISLNLREERLCIERARDTVVPSLHRGSPVIRSFRDRVRDDLDVSEEIARHNIPRISTGIEPMLRDMAASLRDKTVEDAERLFSAEAIKMRRRAIDRCDRAAGRMLRLNDRLQEDRDSVSSQMIHEFMDNIDEIVPLADRFADELEKMAAQYAD